LEDALGDEVVRQKQQDPFAPLLILVPSAALRRRLKILLARERRLSLINFHVLTFHQLSLELYEERYGCRPERLADDLYLKRFSAKSCGQTLGRRSFAGLEERSATRLSPTLRDLRTEWWTRHRRWRLHAGYFGSEDGVVPAGSLLSRFSLSLRARAFRYSDLDIWGAGRAFRRFSETIERIYTGLRFDSGAVGCFSHKPRAFPQPCISLVLNHPAGSS
jgi:hypothetical protein